MNILNCCYSSDPAKKCAIQPCLYKKIYPIDIKTAPFDVFERSVEKAPLYTPIVPSQNNDRKTE